MVNELADENLKKLLRKQYLKRAVIFVFAAPFLCILSAPFIRLFAGISYHFAVVALILVMFLISLRYDLLEFFHAELFFPPHQENFIALKIDRAKRIIWVRFLGTLRPIHITRRARIVVVAENGIFQDVTFDSLQGGQKIRISGNLISGDIGFVREVLVLS